MSHSIAPSRTLSFSRVPIRLRAVWALVLLCQSGALVALDPGKTTSQYRRSLRTVEDGLPQNSIEVIFQCRRGYLWFGTQEGLARFDGVRFEIFDHRNIPAISRTPAIRSSVFVSMAEDRDGNLWLGMHGGVLRMHRGRFTAYTADDGLRGRLVSAMVVGDEGELWIGTRGDGALNRFRDGTFTVYTSDDGLAADTVWALAKGRDGGLWIGTGGGLSHLAEDRFTTYTTADGLPHDQVRALFAAADGTLWVGTEGGLAQLADGRFTTYTTADGLSHPTVNAIAEDRDGNLWAGTDGGGLNRITAGVVSSFGERDGLPGDLVRAIYEDREGSLWVGTDARGLVRFQDESFITYSVGDRLSHQQVNSVYEDRDGNLWIGTFGGGLNRFRNGRFTAYTTADGLSSDHVWSLGEDRAGDLWIGTYGGGLNRFRDGRFESLTTRDGLSSDFIRAILEDRDRSLWIATPRGLNRLRDGRITVFAEEQGLSDESIYCLHEDRAGTLWVGTTNGLCRARDGGRFICFTEADGLSGAGIHAIHEDADGSLWLGTVGNGLHRFKDGSFTVVTSRQGLFHDSAYQILEDGAGNLWMSSNKGVFTLRKADFDRVVRGELPRLRSPAYGRADGMGSFETNGGSQPAGWRSRDGRLWFPTIAGLSVVDPARLYVNEVPPPVVIEELLVDGTSMPMEGIVQIPPGADRIEFRYTALSFRKPSRVVMRYRLEGHDREWIDAGTQRAAFYTSLSPDTYRFVVIAGNEDGVWNEDGAAVEVRIEPHFYQTSTFSVLCVLAALGAAAGFHGFRVRHLRRREQELTRRVEEGVAEHTRMVEALRASEAHLAEAQRVARLGTWEWSIDGDELVWSQEMYRIFGRSEALGPLAEFWQRATHPEDRDGVAERMEQALAGRGDFSLDYRIIVQEKTVRWVHAEADVARDAQGRAVRVIGTTLDITERKLEEERRRKFETQLLETQKLESLGMLAGGIAHQFNNLLVGILGNAGLALMKLSPRSPLRELIEQIEKTGLRASDLAAQMLAFSGKGRFVIEPTDLSAEVKGMAHLLAASISKKVALTYALAPEPPPIDADVTQIHQMVINLIINASEAIGDAEGTITVTTGTMECGREYLSATHLDEDLPAGPYNWLEIADSGCGMDEETRTRAFEPFFSTKFTGRGLGLATVLGIVRGHRGAIKVRSEPFRGTKIRVLLPCSTRAPVAETARAAPHAPEWRGSGTVLLVDDEEPVRLTAQAMLETLGFTVMTAADGRECVDAYERHGDEIRLVVLDHSMPRMGGAEVLRELRRLRREVRIILCSGYSERDVTKDLDGEDLDGFLHKPYQLDTLREKIREVLDREA